MAQPHSRLAACPPAEPSTRAPGYPPPKRSAMLCLTPTLQPAADWMSSRARVLAEMARRQAQETRTAFRGTAGLTLF